MVGLSVRSRRSDRSSSCMVVMLASLKGLTAMAFKVLGRRTSLRLEKGFPVGAAVNAERNRA